MSEAVISGTGVWAPENIISNDELVAAFNAYVDLFNEEHATAIEAGEVEALKKSSPEFIEQASGIRRRYALDRTGPLDPKRMAPNIVQRGNDELSYQAEAGAAAARMAMEQAKIGSERIDLVIVGCSSTERPYPAISVEIQDHLGIENGFAYDMNVACASATFAIQQAAQQIQTGSARAVLVICPEITQPQLDYRDRDSHFIFGDACAACVVERADTCQSPAPWKILDTKMRTKFSSNIRNNFGVYNRCDPATQFDSDKLFKQAGRKVFKEVCPWVAKEISTHLESFGLSADQLARLWLHQANLAMNLHVARKVLGRDPTPEEAPNVLNEFANTSSAGSLIAFHRHRSDLEPGTKGVICAFGAGYSFGSVIVERIEA